MNDIICQYEYIKYKDFCWPEKDTLGRIKQAVKELEILLMYISRDTAEFKQLHSIVSMQDTTPGSTNTTIKPSTRITLLGQQLSTNELIVFTFQQF